MRPASDEVSPSLEGHATVTRSRLMLEGAAFDPGKNSLVLTTANPADAEAETKLVARAWYAHAKSFKVDMTLIARCLFGLQRAV